MNSGISKRVGWVKTHARIGQLHDFFSAALPADAPPTRRWLDERILSRSSSATAASRSDSTGDGRGRFALWMSALLTHCPIWERSAEHPGQATGFDCSIRGAGTFYRYIWNRYENVERFTESSPRGKEAVFLHRARWNRSVFMRLINTMCM